MKVAYLIDREAVGGGMEYIRRKISERKGDECRVFFSERGECFAKNLNAWGADEIHANHLKALLQLFENPIVRPKARVVFTVHGIHLRKFDFLPRTPANRLKRFLRLWLERRLYAKCDQMIALTPTDADEIHRLYGKNLNVTIEPNVVSPSDFSCPKNLRYSQDSFAFVCIARFDFQKGQDILVNAIRLAQDELRRRNARTLMIGAGQTLDEIKNLADKFGITDLIEFAGEIPNAGAYATCGKFLVAPSRWEGMPYLMLEAVARKHSVIASDCPGNIDVLANYPGAQLFKTNDPTSLSPILAKAASL